ncbi:hypothetical protein PAESOLCIP111_00502 [Paenibacillus solanacearum]|uniref:YlzJ-like protein n=1 Tax=Paenibacillus solanacearum TaxID=2048548 RepID=A0A916JTR5_9BACL|nr:YlzJ-like family protein [Paenibacillus solanacearum]CAG7602372.1 hypothetical protein PAESOLCIP111_00502 [Paenibacillus solanacearum]
MIHYSILPLEAVMDNMEAVEQSQTVEIAINGVTMQVQPMNGHQAMIVRLLSCNPQDFLNPQYAPGRMIEFQPVLQG